MSGDTLPNTENQIVETIPQIDNESVRPEPVIEDAAPAPDTQEPEAAAEPVDPRAARMEEIAGRRREQEQEARQQAADTIERTAVEPVAPPAEPERKLKLKIRGEEVELTESEVIARAQKVEAADDYLHEARTLLREAKEANRQPAPSEPQPQPEPKRDRLAEAIEMLQGGGDPAEVRAMLAEEVREQATAAAREVSEIDRNAARSQRYDADWQSGLEAAGAEQPKLMGDPISREVVVSFNAQLQRELIAQQLDQMPETVRVAFANAGITRDSLRSYTPDEARALYRDMALKGYPLPPPSAVIRSAANTIATKWPGSTPPAPAPSDTPPLNRVERKEAHIQPERTSVPKPTNRPAPPRNEQERATSARNELREGRRGVAVRR